MSATALVTDHRTLKVGDVVEVNPCLGCKRSHTARITEVETDGKRWKAWVDPVPLCMPPAAGRACLNKALVQAAVVHLLTEAIAPAPVISTACALLPIASDTQDTKGTK